MRLRKMIYIFVLAMLLLTACGKEIAKTDTKNEQEDNKKQDDIEVVETDMNSQEEKISSNNTDIEEITIDEKIEDSTDESSRDSTSQPISQDNKTSETTVQKPSTEKTTENTSSSDSVNTQKPSTDSITTTSPTDSTTKKPIKRISEETKTAIVPYKYGITKQDITTSDYMLYSDGSKELLDSWSYTIYDSTNYSATDGQLKAEVDANSSKYNGYYQEVLRLVNEVRAEAGVPPLTLDTTLCKAATMRALEMDYNNEMSHTRPNGTDWWTASDFYGARASGENIAAGQNNASSVVNDWKNSPGHYQNMINASYTKLGVGYSAIGIGDYGHYWCQLFSN